MKKSICSVLMLVFLVNQLFFVSSVFAQSEPVSPEADFKENSWRYQDGKRIETEIDSMQDEDDNPIMLFGVPDKQGIDVSKHNGTIDWVTVKNNVDFAIIRCGYGQNYTNQDDAQWYNNIQGCISNGIPCGVYLYSYATSTAAAKSEAEHVLRLVKGYNFQLPIYYDMEDSKTQGTCSNAQLGAIAQTFCDTITNAGYNVGIYANKYWWTSKLTDSAFNNPNWSKWVAQYNSSCTYSGSYDMWQYTSSGRVSGISGNVDRNYWYGGSDWDNNTVTEPITISNVRYENFDDTGFNILCDVTGANRVLFPTWTTGNQSDIIWEECEFDGTTANCRINASDYGNKKGLYMTHIYAYNAKNEAHSIQSGDAYWPDNQNPQISNVEVSNIDHTGYTITCNISDDNRISRISGATWNDEIGREAPYGDNPEGKTEWYDGVINGNTATIRVNSSDYGDRIGGYTTHIWMWDIAGKSTSVSVHATLPGIDAVPKKTVVKGNKIYSIFDVPLSWSKADELAKNKGGYLMEVNSSDEQKIVIELLEYGSKPQYWIGGTDKDSEGTWKWVNGNGISYSNWASGEPNNTNNTEHYMGVYSNGTWNDFQDEHSDVGYITETEISGAPTEYIDNNGHYYYLYDAEVDWHSAKAFCEAMGGHLVTMNDSKEQAFVQSLASRGNGEFTSYYIGASSYKDGKWSWVTNEEFNYTNWSSGEPNNANNIEYYAEMLKTGKWNDRASYNDGEKNGFILEIETDEAYAAKVEYNGNTYLRIDKSLSWEDSKAYCEAIGGHLATIADEEEQEAIEGLFVRGLDTLRSAYSLGATYADDEGVWTWVTGEDFDYDNWDAGEPNNGDGAGEKNYLSIYTKGSQFGLWANNWNFNKNPYDIGFICEIESKEEKPEITPTPTPEPDINENLSTVTVGRVDSKAGAEVVVPVIISDNKGICESKFVLNYDNAILAPVNVEVGEVFVSGSMHTDIENISDDKNTLTVTWENNSIADNVENGIIFNVKFKVSEDAQEGETSVSLNKEQIEIINADGEDISINAISGGVNIKGLEITYGDVNCDGRINIIDIVLLRKYNANIPVEITETGLLAADVNCDGEISNKDILLMRKYVAKWKGIVLGK